MESESTEFLLPDLLQIESDIVAPSTSRAEAGIGATSRRRQKNDERQAEKRDKWEKAGNKRQPGANKARWLKKGRTNMNPPGPMVVVDCAYTDYMNEREVSSLGIQVRQMYAENIRAAKPFKLTVASYGGQLQSNLERVSDKGPESWPTVSVRPEALEEVVPDASKIIYLSPDADKLLEGVDDDHVYVLAGLVDRVPQKGVSMSRCEGSSFQARRLPIKEYMDFRGMTTLALNHVFMILRVLYETDNDWQKAFSAALPKRGLVGAREHPLVGLSGSGSEGEGHSDSDDSAPRTPKE